MPELTAYPDEKNMIIADWIAIGLLLLSVILGAISGFSGGIRRLTKGIFGIIVSVIICYFFLGVVLSWGFVQDILAKMGEWIAGDGSSSMRVWLSESQFVGKVIAAVLLFLVIQIIRIIIVKIFGGVMSSNGFFRFIDRIFGIVLSVCVLVIVCLLAAHIVTWIGGDVENTVIEYLNGSLLKLDKLFLHNPLSYIINGQA